MKKFEVHNVSSEAMHVLSEYEWPGNVRELKSALDYALIHCSGPMVQSWDLPPEIREAHGTKELSTSAGPQEREQIFQALQKTRGKRSEAARLLGMSRSTFYRRLRELEIT